MVDWQQYENEVAQAVQSAIAQFTQQHLEDAEKVYQISIATAPQSRETCIGFETKQHAMKEVQESDAWWRERSKPKVADSVTASLYNENLADFKYAGFHCIKNPSLRPLKQLDFYKEAYEMAALKKIHHHLLQVLNHLLLDNVFHRLPKEDQLWVGVNSPRDWYDCVTDVMTNSKSKKGHEVSESNQFTLPL